MARRDLPAVWISGLLSLGHAACADDIGQTGDGSSGSGSGSSTSMETVTTGEPEVCSGIHQGDLYIMADTDLTTVANIGRVNGTCMTGE